MVQFKRRCLLLFLLECLRCLVEIDSRSASSYHSLILILFLREMLMSVIAVGRKFTSVHFYELKNETQRGIRKVCAI